MSALGVPSPLRFGCVSIAGPWPGDGTGGYLAACLRADLRRARLRGRSVTCQRGLEAPGRFYRPN